MEETTFLFWNWTVVAYLFLAGVSAGAFAVSGLAYLLGREKYEQIIRIGAYIAPFPLVIGIICLVFDLERPWLFWKLMLTLQTKSVMSYGAWLLLIFSILSFVHFYLWLPERFDLVELFQLIPRRWDAWVANHFLKVNRAVQALRRNNVNRFRGLIGIAGIPFALLVGVYTGVLLSVLAARPFWNNPMLPMLFLISALKTGTASISLAGYLIRKFGHAKQHEQKTGTFIIPSLDMALMLLSIIAITLFILGLYVSPLNSADTAGLIMGGEFTFLFWGFVVVIGIFLPLVLEVYELAPNLKNATPKYGHPSWIAGITTLSVLAGGFFLRYVVVYAGQVARIVI
jgi:formate-dependent nitrite reductase membrane component NrfD